MDSVVEILEIALVGFFKNTFSYLTDAGTYLLNNRWPGYWFFYE